MRLKDINYESTKIPISNLVIIVGPNGAGKTTFIRDLYFQFVNSTSRGSNMQPDTRWMKIVSGSFLESSKGEWKDWVENILVIKGSERGVQSAYAARGYMSHDDRGQFLYSDERDIIIRHLQENTLPDLVYLEDNFGRAFKSQHSLLLNVDNRLALSNNNVGNMEQGYTNNLRPAPFLALNGEILSRINRSLRLLFNKQLHVEPHNYPSYSIDVVKAGTKGPKKNQSTTEGLLDNKEIYNKWFKDENVTPLNHEGHGVRATTEILYALENISRKVIFIDEPELHLYPSTKYNLGRIIATYSNKEKQIILVTHDTELLRGLLYGSKNTTVIRINSKRELKHVSSGMIGKSYSPDVLQAAFQDAVILVEGIRDKYVYSNAINEKHFADNLSLQVVSMYGKDRLSLPIDFYEDLEINNAVIADFDIFFSKKKNVKDVIRILRAKRISLAEINNVDSLIDEIVTILAGRQNSNKGINAAGLSFAEKGKIKSLIEILKKLGLFVVPIGSLEDWVNMPAESLAETVLSRYRSASKTKYVELTFFLKEVTDYLK